MNRIVIQTRRPSRDGIDPGAVEVGHWIVSGDRVHLCDENGHKTGDSRSLSGGADPKNVAIALMRGRIGRRNSDFNRPLRYPKMVY
jgi:hypothetical protein